MASSASRCIRPGFCKMSRSLAVFLRGGLGLLFLLPLVWTAGCSNYSASHEYYKARPEARLEIPPGLSRPLEDASMAIPELEGGAATYSSFAGECREGAARPVLPSQENVVIRRDGRHQWLVIKGTPQQVWPWVKEFWLGKGFGLEMDTPALGIMETEWFEYQEGRDGVSYRDSYRTRLERGEQAGTTEIHVTQQGQELAGAKGRWQPRTADNELRIEMLKRLGLYLGAVHIEQEEAKDAQAPVEVRGGGAEDIALVIRGEFPDVWQRVVRAMDELGAVVEKQEKHKRTLIARFATAEEKQAEKNAVWTENVLVPSDAHAAGRYRFEFVEEKGSVQVFIRDLQGKAVKSKRAQEIMNRLQGQLGAA